MCPRRRWRRWQQQGAKRVAADEDVPERLLHLVLSRCVNHAADRCRTTPHGESKEGSCARAPPPMQELSKVREAALRSSGGESEGQAFTLPNVCAERWGHPFAAANCAQGAPEEEQAGRDIDLGPGNASSAFQDMKNAQESYADAPRREGQGAGEKVGFPPFPCLGVGVLPHKSDEHDNILSRTPRTAPQTPAPSVRRRTPTSGSTAAPRPARTTSASAAKRPEARVPKLSIKHSCRGADARTWQGSADAQLAAPRGCPPGWRPAQPRGSLARDASQPPTAWLV